MCPKRAPRASRETGGEAAGIYEKNQEKKDEERDGYERKDGECKGRVGKGVGAEMGVGIGSRKSIRLDSERAPLEEVQGARNERDKVGQQSEGRRGEADWCRE